jgi:hypothetical protein
MSQIIISEMEANWASGRAFRAMSPRDKAKLWNELSAEEREVLRRAYKETAPKQSEVSYEPIVKAPVATVDYAPPPENMFPVPIDYKTPPTHPTEAPEPRSLVDVFRKKR